MNHHRGSQKRSTARTQKERKCSSRPADKEGAKAQLLAHTEGPQVSSRPADKEGAKARLLAHRRTIGVPRDPQIPHTEADIATCESLTHYQGGASPGNDHLANRYASVEHSHIDLGGGCVVGLLMRELSPCLVVDRQLVCGWSLGV